MSSRSKKAARHVQDEQARKALLGDFFPEDIHAYRIDRHSFTIYVGGDPAHAGQTEFDHGPPEPGVEFNMADRFEINLGTLSGIDSARPILVNMASCGGDWEAGMKMGAAILYCPNPVTVLGTKWCRSMTSLIPLFADRFVIRPPAQYMIHHGTYGFSGLTQEANTDDIERRKTTETMLRIYAARLKSQGMYSGMDEKNIREILDEKIRREIDVWLTADEAQRWGFADDVFEGNWKTLRATQVNVERRKLMSAVLRKKIKVDIKIS